MGAIIADKSVSDDTMEAYVYRQNPMETTSMSVGDAVDLFVTNDPSKVPQNSELQPIIPITKPQLKTSSIKNEKTVTPAKKRKSKKHKPSTVKDTTHVN
jgi:beta-lactam-binding protein with PASTA domain